MQALKNIEAALRETDVGRDNGVRTRIYVIDIDDWERIGQASTPAL